jgi:predicted alpha/beta-hydrolase family hydrolase
MSHGRAPGDPNSASAWLAVAMRLAVLGGWVDLDRPRNATALLALTHGAGGGVETRDLLAIRDRALEASVAVALITQPYRVAGRSSPPQLGPQDDAWIGMIATLRKRRGFTDLPLITGGRSNGARVACRTAAQTGAAAVVALAFPVHPPGRPENDRLGELALPTVPVLVVQGDRDPFGMPPKRRGRKVVVIPGADHALRKDIATIAQTVVEFVTSMAARANVAV